jgi:hypothetical protein
MPGEDQLLGATQQMAGNIGSGLSGLLSGITGFSQRSQGKKLLAQNPYPTEQMPTEVLQNQQMAQQMAQQGMPSAQYQQAQKDIQRQQVQALNAATDRRGGLDAIGAIQEGSNQAAGQLNAQDAAMRTQNRLNLQNVNNQVAGWKDKLFDWNQRNKYLQNYRYGMSLIGAGNANIMGGADKLIGGLVGAGAAGAFGSGAGGSALSTSLGSSNPAASSYQGMSPADAGGGGSISPAAGINYINPSSAPSLIGT